MPNSLTRDNARHLAYKTLDDLEWLEKHITYRRAKDLKMIEFKLRDIKKRMLKIIDTYVHDEMMPDDEEPLVSLSQEAPQTGSTEEIDSLAQGENQSCQVSCICEVDGSSPCPPQTGDSLDLHLDEIEATLPGVAPE